MRVYRRRRFIVPVDGFFEWKAIKGQKPKQPYAVAMKDGTPFGLGGLWENWKDPTSGEWVLTFTIITTHANQLVAEIHDRMPLILAPGDCAHWLSDEPDPHDLIRPYASEPMWMRPISTRVNISAPLIWSRSMRRSRRSPLWLPVSSDGPRTSSTSKGAPSPMDTRSVRRARCSLRNLSTQCAGMTSPVALSHSALPLAFAPLLNHYGFFSHYSSSHLHSIAQCPRTRDMSGL